MSEELNLWSVTTIIKLGLGTGDALVNWAARTPVEWAADNLTAFTELVKADREAAIKTAVDSRFRKSGTAAARGSDVHKAAEALALGQKPDVEDHILPYVEQYRRFLDEHQPEFLMAEAPIYNVTQHYAGTCDGIMKLGDETVLYDLKTSDRAPDAKSRPPYPEVALQLAGYRRAELVGLLAERREVNYKRYYSFNPDNHHEPMPETDGAVCIVITPYDCRVVPVRTDDEVFRCFLFCRETARWQVDVSKRVFGPTITAPSLTQ